MSDEVVKPSDLAIGFEATWAPVNTDPILSSQVVAGNPSMTPAGEDLDLHMGWDRYESFALALIRRVQGARDLKFRRYGTQGQAQHGIDLAGRTPDGTFLIVQCKEYQTFTPGDLRAAVKKFAEGDQPFRATAFIVMTSASTQATECAEELATLQDEHPELDLDLWGGEQINDLLRYHPEIVGRFWTRETANVFCTGAPLPGVPAAPLDRQEQAERILLGPLNTIDVAPTLREAEAVRESDPVRSATLLGDLAQRLDTAHFLGHSFVLRRRQLDVMTSASMTDDAVALAGGLATTALSRGQRDTAGELVRLMLDLIKPPAEGEAETDGAVPSQRHRHVELVEAAVNDAVRPFGSPTRLLAALPAREGVTDPGYHHVLVLCLAEDLFATEPARLPEIDDLLTTAISQIGEDPHSDILLRLRLTRAEYDPAERVALNVNARRHLVSRRAAALIAAREARRCANDGRADEALEAWRDAVSDGIESGLDQEAADWLYAIRALNVRYGPWTTAIDDEHRLAQALRATASGSFLERHRSPREAALAALTADRPIAAVLDARRWLIDACVTGSWATEAEALKFLADRYASSREPMRAAQLYQRAGEGKKLVDLANDVADVTLPIGPLRGEPWWVVTATLKQVSAQEDLLDRETAAALLTDVVALARRGQTGELVDSPGHSLSTQALETACDLSHRGTHEQAQDVLDLLSGYVDREPNHGWATDKRHAACCVAIALTHPTLGYPAMTRLIDLADAGAQEAQKALLDDQTRALLSGHDEDQTLPHAYPAAITDEQRNDLRSRIITLAEDGRYLSDVLLESIAPHHDIVQARARSARDSILNRSEPIPGVVAYGTGLVKDAYLASLLSAEEAQPCLEKLMAVARDSREAASNRQDALIGARNLVLGQPLEIRIEIFRQAKDFVTGPHERSAFDRFTGESHPLSAFRVSTGSASLRGDGLRLAHAAMAHDNDPDQERWVLQEALALFASREARDIHAAALVIHQLPAPATTAFDASHLATREQDVLRQVAVALTVREPERYADLLLRQARDPAYRVRRNLAQSIARVEPPLPAPLLAVRDVLVHDKRYSVRSCLDSLAQAT